MLILPNEGTPAAAPTIGALSPPIAASCLALLITEYSAFWIELENDLAAVAATPMPDISSCLFFISLPMDRESALKDWSIEVTIVDIT